MVKKNLMACQHQLFKAMTDLKNGKIFLKQHDATNLLKPTATLSEDQQLIIYQNSIKMARMGLLADTYTVCRRLTGEDFFQAMTEIYVCQTPSYQADIHAYGASFSTFIADFQPAACLPYLADVAALEWAYTQALLSADQEPSQPDLLQNLTESQQSSLKITLPEGSSLIISPYPIVQIWSLHQENFPENVEINWNDGDIKILVWRQGMDVRMDLLSDAEWYLLTCLKKEPTLATLAEDWTTQINESWREFYPPSTSIPALDICLAKSLLKGWIRFKVQENQI